MTLLSMSLKEYLQSYTGDKQTTCIQLAYPFSLRHTPSDPRDFAFNNRFAVLPIRLALVEDFGNGFRQISAAMSNVRQSITPFAMVFMHKAILIFPPVLRDLIMNDFSKRITFMYTNVAGPTSQMKICGSNSLSQGFFLAPFKTIGGAISVVSYNKKLKICMAVDRSVIKSPERLMKILYSNLDSQFGMGWRFHKD